MAQETTGITLSAALPEKWILVFKESKPKSAHSFLSTPEGVYVFIREWTYDGKKLSADSTSEKLVEYFSWVSNMPGMVSVGD